MESLRFYTPAESLKTPPQIRTVPSEGVSSPAVAYPTGVSPAVSSPAAASPTVASPDRKVVVPRRIEYDERPTVHRELRSFNKAGLKEPVVDVTAPRQTRSGNKYTIEVVYSR